MRPYNGYFISSGQGNVMYTLRRHEIRTGGGVVLNGVFSGSHYEVDTYVETLTGDIETAIEKAFKITGFILPDPNITTNDRRENGTGSSYVNPDVVPIGKYSGTPVKDMTDVNYMLWFIDTFSTHDRYSVFVESMKNLDIVKTAFSMFEAKKANMILKEKEDEESARIECENSEFFGNVGDRIEITATIDKIITGIGDYGCWGLTLMTDADGKKLAYFNFLRDKNGDDVGEGCTVKFKATIKSHELKDHWTWVTYKFKQTMLSRASKCKIISEAPTTYNHEDEEPKEKQ